MSEECAPNGHVFGDDEIDESLRICNGQIWPDLDISTLKSIAVLLLAAKVIKSNDIVANFVLLYFLAYFGMHYVLRYALYLFLTWHSIPGATAGPFTCPKLHQFPFPFL